MDNARYEVVFHNLKRRRNRLALVALFLSTIVTVVSVISASYEDESDKGISQVLKYVVTGIAGILTLITGYIKLYNFDSKVQDLENVKKSNDDAEMLKMLNVMYDKPSRREMSYEEFDKKRQKIMAARYAFETQISNWLSPSEIEATLLQIFYDSPETWNTSMFGISIEIRYPGCKKSGPRNVTHKAEIPYFIRLLGLVRVHPLVSDSLTARGCNEYTMGVLQENWPLEYAQQIEDAEACDNEKKRRSRRKRRKLKTKALEMVRMKASEQKPSSVEAEGSLE